jgi:hypothetical protein
MQTSNATLTLRFQTDFGELVVEESFPMEVFKDENFDFNWLIRNQYDYATDQIEKQINETVNKFNQYQNEKNS